MQKPISGQRWISEAEPELGLGTLVDIQDRTLSVRFESSDCTRQYARRSAPLKRVIFKPGDQIQLRDNKQLTIETLSESRGLIYYSGEGTCVCEKDILDTISFSMPQERLFAGIMDANTLFDLRYRLLESISGYDASPVKGFLGGQVELIPHQFFIADKVTSRYIPRVLLSDETGLGKTIEACLVLHNLLMTDRIKRVMIIVPDSLVHQWFIELYRKFNLSFMVFNAADADSLDQESPGRNPFLEHQLGIASIDFIARTKRQTQLLEAGWDMVVIDEAHHITDDRKTHGIIKALAEKTFGLMLLTATPEQMGIKNHFLHLQLLDPERYFDFDTYCRESAGYEKTIKKIKALVKKNQPVDHILDSYGPGRVIFRNKRDVIQGFPKRKARLIPLAGTQAQVLAINREFSQEQETAGFDFAQDPRTSYLIDLIKQKKKILVICCSKEKVSAVDQAIATHLSVDIARFDETMTLLQRDRNAAWFSREEGARVLICSEIGSEGRNFQFVHHLFLFDLPRNPELLEQRIGRVDRIGQTKEIQIHVPFVLGSVHEVMAKWYMDGLNLFEKNINGVHLIYQKFKPDLQDLFRESEKNTAIDEPCFKALIGKTKDFCSQVEKELTRGKNILLEMNSFKPEPAKKKIAHITRTDADKTLKDLLVKVLDHYGIEVDFIDDTIFKLSSDAMTDEKFPALTSLASALTFKRGTAIVRDDVDFFSWDHPFVRQTFDFFLTHGTGSCATALLPGQGLQGVLLETVFILECVAPKHLTLERYLMPAPLRVVVDHLGNDVTGKHDATSFSRLLVPDQSHWFKDLEPVRQVLIPEMIEKSHAIARVLSKQMIQQGTARIKKIIGQEITRLGELKKINPDIRAEEIMLAQTRMDSLLQHLSAARIRMDALRLIRVQ